MIRLPEVPQRGPGVGAEIESARAHVRQILRQAQVTGGIVALMVSIVLCGVSANGVVVAISTIISGISVSLFTMRLALRRHSARRQSQLARASSAAGVEARAAGVVSSATGVDVIGNAAS